MYEPSRVLATFYIAGFQFGEGALVLDALKPGMRLQMVAEHDNPHDSSAIALYFEGKRLGYIPADHNELFAVMMHYGHADAFECVVQQVAPERSPWHQVRAAVYVADSRSSTGR
ncbi:HIRAN domain-containing protein [Collinsella intestinalis]|uniref:HIRAN domain-containing protein n=1 Tax=Collinsella intestinalis TaxID=147207 RepID=UPI00195B0BBC|nr:HIRAN domain-containing protein [Collinsella intestinalis]MBM6907337.1 HIRAN domain-containing protein [Collinsella intestinalis]